MATERYGQATLIQVDTSGVGGAGANWVSLPLQKAAKIDYAPTVEDISTKADSGWVKEAITGCKWTISCDCSLDPWDSTISYLRTQFRALTKVWIRYKTVDGANTTKEEATAVITKWSEDHSNKKVIAVSLEFSMQGAPVTSVAA